MKILYLDLGMGAAGDMLSAALADLLENPGEFIDELNAMNIPGVKVSLSSRTSRGICGRAFFVCINGAEEDEKCHGHSMHDIAHIVEALDTGEDIKEDILNVYNIIARAEGKIHGTPVKEIHFHEVGMLDAVADIAAVCLAMKKISPDKVVASPVHVGSGTVKCAHGILPVPSPATAEILSGIPIYGGEICGELCTPTGAALLKYFVSGFGNMPIFVPERIGYGVGKREFEMPNCVRAFIGHAEEVGEAVELRANIDDMTGEDIAFATEKLIGCGALDVWTESIGMKKARPGVMLCVLCKSEEVERFSALIFRHTSTLGVREIKCTRRVLSRRIQEVKTRFGSVRKKISEGYGTYREKIEYEDIASIAKESGESIAEVRKMLSKLEK